LLKVLTDERIYEQVIQEGARRAKHSLWIATANVRDFFMSFDTHTGPVLEMFEELCARKVDVRLLHSGVPTDTFLEDFKRRRQHLSEKYFQMRRCTRVHFKIMLIDNRQAYIGSANLTGAGIGMRSGGRRNFELGIVTDDDAIMDDVAGYFLSVWEGDECPRCRLGDKCPVPLESPFGE